MVNQTVYAIRGRSGLLVVDATFYISIGALIASPIIAVIAAYLTNVWSRRSAREEFRRDKTWDRKFALYEQLFSNLVGGYHLTELDYLLTSGKLEQGLQHAQRQMSSRFSGSEPAGVSTMIQIQMAEFLLVHAGMDPGWRLFPEGNPQEFTPEVLLNIDLRIAEAGHTARLKGVADYERLRTAVEVLGQSLDLSFAQESVSALVRGGYRSVPAGSDAEENWRVFKKQWAVQRDYLLDLIREELDATIEGRSVKRIPRPSTFPTPSS